MVQKWFPMILLILFTVISVAALSKVARDMAQKRTILSDPLCKVVWNKKRPSQIPETRVQAGKLKIGRNEFSTVSVLSRSSSGRPHGGPKYDNTGTSRYAGEVLSQPRGEALSFYRR